jgi:tetratricopeptide (TPR) repeat protein
MVLRRFIFFLLLPLFLFSSNPALCQSDPVEEARVLLRKGMDHYKKGEYEKAYDKFLSAFRKVESLDRKDVLAALIMNIGLSLWKLNRPLEAHEQFVLYLEISPNEEKKQTVKEYLKELGSELLKTHAFVTINAEPPESEIIIKDPYSMKKIKSAHETLLPFGVYAVYVKMEGFKEKTEKLIIEKDKSLVMNIRLDKLPEKTEPFVFKPAEPDEQEKKKPEQEIKITKKAEKKRLPQIYGWIGLGTGAVFLGTGIAMTVSAVGYADRINSLNKDISSKGYQTDDDIKEYNSYLNSIKSRSTLSYIFYGAGFAAAAGSVAYILFFSDFGDKVSIVPVVNDGNFYVMGAVNF